MLRRLVTYLNQLPLVYLQGVHQCDKEYRHMHDVLNQVRFFDLLLYDLTHISRARQKITSDTSRSDVFLVPGSGLSCTAVLGCDREQLTFVRDCQSLRK